MGTPPPRSIQVGDVLERAFGVYRANLATLVLVAAIPELLLQLGLTTLLRQVPADLLVDGRLVPRAAGAAGLDDRFVALGSVALQLMVLMTVLLSVEGAALTRAAAAGLRGAPLGVGGALAGGLRAAPRVIATVLGALVLVSLGAFAAGAGTLAGAPDVVVAVLTVLAIGFAVYLAVGLALAPVIASLESVSPIDALRRSLAATRGVRMRTLSVIVTLGLIQMVLSALIGALSGGSSAGADDFAAQALGFLFASLWAPFEWAALTALYDRLATPPGAAAPVVAPPL